MRGILCMLTIARSYVEFSASTAGCAGLSPRTAACRSCRYACHSCAGRGGGRVLGEEGCAVFFWVSTTAAVSTHDAPPLRLALSVLHSLQARPVPLLLRGGHPHAGGDQGGGVP